VTHATYRITCDCCNRREFSQGDESERDTLDNAEAAGWTFRKVKNGAMLWDLCPECSRLETDKLP